MFPRSSNKPMQALGMLRNGLDLDGELLALAGASHSGEQFHLDGVRRILAGAGLDESALRTPAGVPDRRAARDEWVRAGHGRRADHDELLRQARRDDRDLSMRPRAGRLGTTTGRRNTQSSKAIRTAIEDSAGEKVSYIAVDGCGAPMLAISLAGLARSFGLFAAAAPGTLEARVADAFRAHPEYASGSTRDEAELMHAVAGLFCKAGAESVYAVGLADGRGIAVKVEDGTPRARAVVMAAYPPAPRPRPTTMIERHLHFPLLRRRRPGRLRPAAILFVTRSHAHPYCASHPQ